MRCGNLEWWKDTNEWVWNRGCAHFLSKWANISSHHEKVDELSKSSWRFIYFFYVFSGNMVWIDLETRWRIIRYLKGNVGAKLCVMQKRLSLICFMLVINLDVASFAAVDCQGGCYNFRRNSSSRQKRRRISPDNKLVVIPCRSSLSRAEGNKRCSKRENMSCVSGGGWYIVQFSLECGTKVRTRHRDE